MLMGSLKEKMFDKEQEKFERNLSDYFGISYDDLGELSYEIHTNESSDGLIYEYILEFKHKENTKQILSKIHGIDDNGRVRIDISTFDKL